MLCAEAPRDRGLLRTEPVGSGGVTQGAQRVQDHRDIDELLQERTPDRGQVAKGSHDHRRERQADPDDHALVRDTPAAARDDDGFAEPVEAIDSEDDVGRF